MGPILLEEIKQKLVVIDEVADVVVELVFDPHRLQEMMPDEAKLTSGRVLNKALFMLCFFCAGYI
jgi:metal-sulfur cluster biosynthetic enzyme